MTTINLRNFFQKFPYHLVEISPWPILVSFSLLTMAIGAVMYMQGYPNGGSLLSLGFILTTYGMALWFRDIIIEGTYLGCHTIQVQKGLTIGVVLFIISEVFAFLSVFWAFFHSSLSPAVELGCVWPPQGITALDPFAIPLLNTILLLSSGVCHKCDLFFEVILCSATLPFSTLRVSAEKRIGPHNMPVLSILLGSLLGDASMEKSVRGARFAFYQSSVHAEYLLWLHRELSINGYAKLEIPVIRARKDPNGRILYCLRFRTFTYSSFNWIYDAFYPNNRKVVPQILETYLTPLALAVWLMDDGTLHKNKGVTFCTHGFTLKEVQYLASVLKKLYSLDTNLHKTGHVNKYSLYIPKSNLNKFIAIVEPYVHPSMLYKIHGSSKVLNS